MYNTITETITTESSIFSVSIKKSFTNPKVLRIKNIAVRNKDIR
jgi:hypothetical protein